MNETCLSQPEASRQLLAAIVMANSMRSGVYSSSSGSFVGSYRASAMRCLAHRVQGQAVHFI